MKSGIYVITNMVNLKCYVGSSVDVKKRIAQHKNSLIRQDHQNGHLQNAWNKYGENAFMFEWVEQTDDLENREQFWMDDMRVFELGYNLAPIAYSNRGVKHTAETKLKFSLAKIGKSPANKGKPMPEEQKIKCAPTMFKKGFVPHNKGVPMSDDTREKVSKAVRESHQRPEVREKVSKTWFQPGRKQSDEEKEKRRIAMLNYYASLTPEERKARHKRECSEETRRKLSESSRGRNHSEETRKKMSEARKGKPGLPRSEETRKKMSEARMGRKMPEETRRKISETKKARLLKNPG